MGDAGTRGQPIADDRRIRRDSGIATKVQSGVIGQRKGAARKRERAGTERTCVCARAQCARVDRGCAGVSVRTGERERAGAGFGERADLAALWAIRHNPCDGGIAAAVNRERAGVVVAAEGDCAANGQ